MKTKSNKCLERIGIGGCEVRGGELFEGPRNFSKQIPKQEREEDTYISPRTCFLLLE